MTINLINISVLLKSKGSYGHIRLLDLVNTGQV
jgi:hypothetical protein